MRKEDKNRDDGKGKVKFRFVEFELEGSNATLQESLRNIASAITRGNNPLPIRNIEHQASRTALPTSRASSQPDTNEDDADAMATQDDNETLETQTAQPERREGKRTRKPPKLPQLINDLDTKSSVSLADYCTEKSPKTISEKYLVIGGWFKHHRQTEEISVNHIYTCFSVLDWKDRPDDMGQVFRNIKKNQQWFDNGSSQGFWKLNIKGINYVDNKMGSLSNGE